MLTVLIPSYNHEKFIVSCLTAASKIAISPLKIIIIDDGSKDNTSDVVADFVGRHPAIDISFIQKDNQGVVSSLNMGLAMTASQFVYLCASDDIPNAIGIERCVRMLCKDNSKSFIIGGSKNRVKGVASQTYRRSHAIFFANTTRGIRDEMFFDYPKPLLLQSTIFRTSALRAVGGWDSDIVIDDYSMFIKLFSALERNEYTFIPSINVVEYRIHDGNSSKDTIRQYETQQQLLAKYAAPEIVNKAIAYRLVFHILSNLRKKQFSNIRLLLGRSSFTQIIHSIRFLPKMLLKIISGTI